MYVYLGASRSDRARATWGGGGETREAEREREVAERDAEAGDASRRAAAGGRLGPLNAIALTRRKRGSKNGC